MKNKFVTVAAIQSAVSVDMNKNLIKTKLFLKKRIFLRPKKIMMGYNLLPMVLFLLILYVVTYFLYTDSTISTRSFKLFWNMILIASSLIVALIGILMVIYINLAILPIDTSLIFWHVEAGIIATVTGIFHIHTYRKQFMNIFK